MQAFAAGAINGVTMGEVEALLWDVDGTLAESERDGHRVAFNLAFEACGVPWRWNEARYGELLRVTGGRERLLHDMQTQPDAPTMGAERAALATAIHQRKNHFYAELVRSGGIPLREGVVELMQQCHARSVRMGIATTTSRTNVDALMRHHLGAHWADGFAVLVCGEDVQHKKPDPEVYVRALQGLGIGPLHAVAIEDSPGGVAAARAAGIPVVVTLSAYFGRATIEGAVAIGPGLHTRQGWRPGLVVPPGDRCGVGLDDIAGWCAQMDSVSQYA
jgi:HAD superfamily hydrolase (TIGR01509 family)